MAHGKQLAGRTEAWLKGSGRSWGKDSTVKADKGAAASGSCPAPGISKPKPATYLKKKREKEKEKEKEKST